MRFLIATCFLVFAGCTSEPTFDERYDAAEARIAKKAAELDEQLADAENGSNAGDPDESETVR